LVLKKVVGIVGLVAGGWLGWVAGAPVSPMFGYFTSVLGSAVGLFVTLRWASRYY